MGYEYRVTKYDPGKRDENGVYTVDEWTEWIMFSQVGSIVGGSKLTLEEYLRTEDAYVATAIRFLSEAGVPSVTVRQLADNGGEAAKLNVREGSDLDHEQAACLMRLILRDLAWCRLESDDSFVHFGWDYYMYIGVPVPCDQSRAFARERGLFVEEFPSPYRGGCPDEDDQSK
ncbi:MAG: hypothetical protein JXB13_06330 [Phycisphaerae bacterium]|nr:hypothetical protein [Phycisphaerae bacterium]